MRSEMGPGCGATAFEVQGVHFGYGPRDVFRDLSLAIPSGFFTAVVGPNGCGKSTLLNLLARVLAPVRGTIALDGRTLARYRQRDLARRVALVPQEFAVNFPFTVREVVMMGRYAHVGRFAAPGVEDFEAVEGAMEALGVEGFADVPVTRLSGGERQRTVVARALAQEAPVLLLDEATSSLDVHHALDILHLLGERVRQERLTVVAVMHDLNLAAAHADRCVFLRDGGVVEEGETPRVFRTDVIQAVFGVEARVREEGGKPHAVFRRLGEDAA